MIGIYNSDVVISRHTINLKDLFIDENAPPIILEQTLFDVGFILSRNRIITSDPLIKTEFIKNVRFNEKLKRFQDHEFFIRLFRQKMNLCFIDDRLYYHRQNKQSISAATVKGDKIMIDTQIAVHKEMNLYYANELLVLHEYKRKAIKMYKELIVNGYAHRVLNHYIFFKKSFSLSFIEFTLFYIINIIFKKGFDKMKYRISK